MARSVPVLLLIRVALLGMIGLTGGCIVLPVPTPEHGLLSGRGEIEAGDLTEFVPGKTTREQVLLMLGEPGLSLGHGRILVYEWSVTRAYVVWAVGAYYSGAGGIAPLGKQYLFLVEFDDDGVLKRSERLPVKLFQSFAAAVDAWTPDDVARLAALSRLEVQSPAGQGELKRLLLHVPTDGLQFSGRPVAGRPLQVRLPPESAAADGPHWVGFKTPGNQYAIATILTADSPDQMLRNALLNGWRQGDLQVVNEGGVGLSWQIRKFSVSSPVHLTTWDAEGLMDVEVTIIQPGRPPEQRFYRTVQTVRSLFGPDAEDFSEVLRRCLSDIGGQLTEDLLALD